jgi:hypothetical protein
MVRITAFFLKVVIVATLSAGEGSASSADGAAPAGSISSCAILLHSLEMGGTIENDIFLRDLPYDAYLDNCDVADFARLERDRSLLEENGRDGDKFLSSLFSQYLLRHSPNSTVLNHVNHVFDLADRALAYGTGDERRPPIYVTIGYMLLDDLNDRVKLAISKRQLAQDSRETEYLLKALADRGYLVAFPTSNWEKLIRHALAGDRVIFRYGLGRRSCNTT